MIFQIIIAVLGCKPVQILGIIRHGTRTAYPEFNDEMNSLSSIQSDVFNSFQNRENSILIYFLAYYVLKYPILKVYMGEGRFVMSNYIKKTQVS